MSVASPLGLYSIVTYIDPGNVSRKVNIYEARIDTHFTPLRDDVCEQDCSWCVY